MRIGYLHPRRGVAAIWTPSQDAASFVAATEINAGGGILGEEVELVFADCGISADAALDAVDRLLEIEEVDAIIGGHPSSIRDVISHRIDGKVPYIYTPQYEGLRCGPTTLAIGVTDQELLAPALQWFRSEKGADRFFFVGNDYIWPHMARSTTRRMVARQGGQLVGEAVLPFVMEDYDALFRQIRQSGAQVVVQALLGQSSVDFNRAFAHSGMAARCLSFGLIVDETVVCAIGPDATENLYTAAAYFASQRSRSNDRFLQLYHDLFGRFAPPVSASSIGAYEGLHLLAGLARECGTHDGHILMQQLGRRTGRSDLRHRLSGKPAGTMRNVFLAEARGTELEIVATLDA